MGSRFTANEAKMTIVLAELKKKKYYFVDSRTSAQSVAFEVAKKLGVRAAKRNIFLDNDLSENALKIQMERLLSLARQRGQAIGIGHPHKETLGLLRKYRPHLRDNVEMVPASRLVK